MYTGLQHLHSFLAYLVLALLIIAIGYSLFGWLGNKPFSKKGKILSLIALIATHIQFLIGLVIYFVSPLGFSNFSGEAMGDSLSRLYMLEHPLMMILGIAAITWGYSKGKKMQEDKKKFRTVAIFYLAGLVLILSRIPWQAWM